MRKDILAEWLRRETRNLVGFPAQVRILQMSFFLPFGEFTFSTLHLQIQTHSHTDANHMTRGLKAFV